MEKKVLKYSLYRYSFTKSASKSVTVVSWLLLIERIVSPAILKLSAIQYLMLFTIIFC